MNKRELDQWLVNLNTDHPIRFWLLVTLVGCVAALPLCAVANWLSRW